MLLFLDMTLYMVVATDADGDTISYYISPTSLNSDIFQVDSVSGDVSTQPGKVLDREVCVCVCVGATALS